MAKVVFSNITFHYGDKCILDNFSLTVEESQIMCLVGPSGCGKTTLVRCLLGFIKPETGEIWLEINAFLVQRKASMFLRKDAISEWYFRTMQYGRIYLCGKMLLIR